MYLLRRRTATIALLSLFLYGCAPREAQLSGTVTFRGQPAQAGEIMFTGDESRGYNCPGVMVEIKGGKYRTPAERGHWGGPYVAHVTLYQGQATVAQCELHIDLPQGNTSYDIVVPDSAGVETLPKK